MGITTRTITLRAETIYAHITRFLIEIIMTWVCMPIICWVVWGELSSKSSFAHIFLLIIPSWSAVTAFIHSTVFTLAIIECINIACEIHFILFFFIRSHFLYHIVFLNTTYVMYIYIKLFMHIIYIVINPELISFRMVL